MHIISIEGQTVTRATTAQVLQAIELGEEGTSIVFIHYRGRNRSKLSTLAYIMGEKRVVREHIKA